jgi:hypothetical protein
VTLQVDSRRVLATFVIRDVLRDNQKDLVSSLELAESVLFLREGTNALHSYLTTMHTDILATSDIVIELLNANHTRVEQLKTQHLMTQIEKTYEAVNDAVNTFKFIYPKLAGPIVHWWNKEISFQEDILQQWSKESEDISDQYSKWASLSKGGEKQSL